MRSKAEKAAEAAYVAKYGMAANLKRIDQKFAAAAAPTPKPDPKKKARRQSKAATYRCMECGCTPKIGQRCPCGGM